MDEGRRRFRSNTIALLFLQGAKYLFPFVTLPYLSRVLGADGFAVRAYLVSFMVFAQVIIDYGFAQYGTKLVAENVSFISKLGRINSTVTIAKLSMSLAVLVIISAVTPSISIMSENKLYVALAFGATIFKSLLPDFLLQGLEDMKAITVRFVVTQTVAVSLILLCVNGPSDLLLVPIFEGLGSALSLILTHFYLKKKYDIWFNPCSASDLVQMMKHSTPFFFAVAASAIMGNAIMVLMGLFDMDSHTIAVWSIVNTIMIGIQAIWQPISKSLFPHMVKRRDTQLLRKLMLRGEFLVVIAVLVCIVFAREILWIIGGEAYLGNESILRYVSVTLLFSYPISLIGYPVLGAFGYASKLSTAIGITGLAQISVLSLAGLNGILSTDLIIAVRIGSEILLLCLLSFFARAVLSTKPPEER